MMSEMLKGLPKWVEININALEHNIRGIREKVGPDKRICAVIKANAYGHGAVDTAEVLLANGADQLAVSSYHEAEELRAKFKDTDILVLGIMPDDILEKAVALDLQIPITSKAQSDIISQAAVKLGKTARIHVAVDSGMTRIGFQMTQTSAEEIIYASKLPGIDMEGIFTHYATADEKDKAGAMRQLNRFLEFVQALEAEGLNFKWKHTSNSAAIMEIPSAHLNMVRPGIILYGVYPSDEVDRSELDIKQVMTFKAVVSHTKVLSKRRGISYGLKASAPPGATIATVPVGYADGYSRCMSGKAEILFGGKRLPVLGNICMDQFMVDASETDHIKPGDVVTMIGTDGDNIITADDLAVSYGTIGYEVLCGISRRIPRVYVKDGVPVKTINYLDIY